VSTRQRNAKNEYCRALGHAVSEGEPQKLTADMIQAIAVVAEVVMDKPDLVVTPGDVRTALFPVRRKRERPAKALERPAKINREAG
jgi:hypothetical protein